MNKQGKTMYANAILTELIALYESKQMNERLEKIIKELKFVRLHLAQLSIENDELKETTLKTSIKNNDLEAAYKTMYRKTKRLENDLTELKKNIV